MEKNAVSFLLVLQAVKEHEEHAHIRDETIYQNKYLLLQYAGPIENIDTIISVC